MTHHCQGHCDRSFCRGATGSASFQTALLKTHQNPGQPALSLQACPVHCQSFPDAWVGASLLFFLLQPCILSCGNGPGRAGASHGLYGATFTQL